MSNCFTATRRVAQCAAISALIAAQGCDATTRSTTDLDRVAVRLHVTGKAAATLNGAGEFQLEAPRSLNGNAIIAPAQARRLAMAFLRVLGRSFHSAWETDRGASIDLSTLSPSSRVYFAQSPYQAVERRDVHQAYRRDLGPYYVLTLNSGAEPVIVIAVSALAVDYRIDATGRLIEPVETGMDFVHEGIPGKGGFGLLSPEEAAVVAAEAAGAQVENVPELVVAGGESSPTLARWKVDLDRPVEIQTPAGGRRTVRSLYVGGQSSIRFAVPQPGQSSSRSIPMRMGIGGPENVRATVTVKLHPGRTDAFDQAHVNRVED